MSLTAFAWISLAVAAVCALVIVADGIRHPPAMGVMRAVWPLSALYLSVFALWAYFTLGRKRARAAAGAHGDMHPRAASLDRPRPTLAQVVLATSHCGAGCTVADVGTEFAIASLGIVWFGSILTTDYVLDFLVAWALGILFQYVAIRPMRPNESKGDVLKAAAKADTLSILAFQVGMYLWMALVYFRLFLGPRHLTPFDPRYWLMMQIAMICGFATSAPMNWLLIRLRLKEAM